MPKAPKGIPREHPNAASSHMGDRCVAATSLRCCGGTPGDQDGRGTNELSKIESILGTRMSQNLSRDRRLACHHAKYYAHELTRQAAGDDIDRISTSLFDASVDLNPHQIEAALFALRSPLSKGVLLADEVGLGKTIEAGLVLCQYWAERKRKLLIICPASLRRQWAAELSEKFNLPTVILDATSVRRQRQEGIYNPLDQNKVIIRCPPWRAKRRRVVPGSREATRDTRRAEGAKGDPKGASERGVQSYGRPVCSRNELAMLWRNAG